MLRILSVTTEPTQACLKLSLQQNFFFSSEIQSNIHTVTTWHVWHNGRAFDHNTKGRRGCGFKPRSDRFQVTALGKLLTHVCLRYQAA